MAKRVTMEQIASALNVSKGLVSRALTDTYGVSDEMRTLIRMKAVELGYDFNMIKTKKKKKIKIGLLISSRTLTREAYWQPIIRQLETTLLLCGIDMIYFIYDEKSFSESDRQNFRNMMVEGYVVISKNLPFIMEELEAANKPTVIIDPLFPYPSKFLQIKSSNFESAYEEAKYLLDNGLKHLLYFGSTTFSLSYLERYKGVEQCVADHSDDGATFYALDIDNSNYVFAAPERLSAMLREHDISAIVCCSDLFAVSALKTVKEMGLRVPEDISIVGFDNTIESTIVTPELTTVDIPREKMGEEAGKFLIEAIETGKIPYTSLVINCDIVKRQSVKERGDVSQD